MWAALGKAGRDWPHLDVPPKEHSRDLRPVPGGEDARVSAALSARAPPATPTACHTHSDDILSTAFPVPCEEASFAGTGLPLGARPGEGCPEFS